MPESVIRTGKLVVDMDTRSVDVDGHRLHVTRREYSILELLSLRKGVTVTKEMFLDHLYGGIDEPELKIIDVFICKLRKKIAQATCGLNYIETVPWRGYRLTDHPGSTQKSPNTISRSCDRQILTFLMVLTRHGQDHRDLSSHESSLPMRVKINQGFGSSMRH